MTTTAVSGVISRRSMPTLPNQTAAGIRAKTRPPGRLPDFQIRKLALEGPVGFEPTTPGLKVRLRPSHGVSAKPISYLEVTLSVPSDARWWRPC